MSFKKPFRQVFFYAFAMIIAVVLLVGVLQIGQSSGLSQVVQGSEVNWMQAAQIEFSKNISSPLTGLIFQILTILVFSRFCSYILNMVGQPQVIGEMIAGILIGKSVFGYFWPEAFEALFPDTSMPRLYFLSQIGLVFFMFIVGLNLKISELRNRGSAAVMISHASIVLPFILGCIFAMGLYKPYGPANYDFISFALFIGIAMSITAFPVLARILQERQMTNTPLGAMALTCAAVDDVTAWCVLASVIGIVRAGSALNAVVILLSALMYVVFMLKLARPFIEKRLHSAVAAGEVTRGQLAFIFCIVLGSAMVAEVIGIHAVFGAFLAGVVMPQNHLLRSQLIEKLEDVTVVVLLPLFFVYTGIRTQIGLLDSWQAWLVCLAVVAVAIVGKMLGSALAARWTGMTWPDSWALGALMNTRGLMELIVLNIGYDLGILSPTLFTMFVVMAIVTTTMTAPILSLILPMKLRNDFEKSFEVAKPVYIDAMNSASQCGRRREDKSEQSHLRS